MALSCSALDEGWHCGGGGGTIGDGIILGIMGGVILSQGTTSSEESRSDDMLTGPPTPWMGHGEEKREARGWAPGEAEGVVANPSRTDPSGWDNRVTPPEPATRYYDENGHSVTVNDVTGEIIQVSDKNDPDWKDDDNMTPRQ